MDMKKPSEFTISEVEEIITERIKKAVEERKLDKASRLLEHLGALDDVYTWFITNFYDNEV